VRCSGYAAQADDRVGGFLAFRQVDEPSLANSIEQLWQAIRNDPSIAHRGVPSACIIDLDELVVLALGVCSPVSLLDEEDYAFLIGVGPFLLELPRDGWRLNARQELGPRLQLWQQTALADDVEDGVLIASPVAME
jgi:hypothetical protein